MYVYMYIGMYACVCIYLYIFIYLLDELFSTPDTRRIDVMIGVQAHQQSAVDLLTTSQGALSRRRSVRFAPTVLAWRCCRVGPQKAT